MAIALLTLGLSAAVSFWLLPHHRRSVFEGIEVRGDTRFIEQIESALGLLRDKSPRAFELTQQYVKRIQQSRRSGMRAYADPPTFDLAEGTAYYSLTWCAGSIAHDTFHSKLYHEYRRAHGEPVPDDKWAGKARELECNTFQLQVLKDIEAPTYEVSYLQSLDGSHCDLDGNGLETWTDYRKRDW